MKNAALIVIPAYNESKIIAKVLKSLPRKLPGISKIDYLVIDDGSQDNTFQIVESLKIKVIRHMINRGLGVAIGTGIKYAILHKFKYIITFDADGQHSSEDIFSVIKPLVQNKADVVIGSRLIKSGNMPLLRKIINNLSNFATFFLFNIWTTDSQSGLRGFNRKAFSRIQIRTQRMEVSSEIFKEIKRLNLRKTEVGIKSIYTKYSLKKGQQISNAPIVFWKLLLQKFRYI